LDVNAPTSILCSLARLISARDTIIELDFAEAALAFYQVLVCRILPNRLRDEVFFSMVNEVIFDGTTPFYLALAIENLNEKQEI
jgi:hypothetical protein